MDMDISSFPPFTLRLISPLPVESSRRPIDELVTVVVVLIQGLLTGINKFTRVDDNIVSTIIDIAEQYIQPDMVPDSSDFSRSFINYMSYIKTEEEFLKVFALTIIFRISDPTLVSDIVNNMQPLLHWLCGQEGKFFHLLASFILNDEYLYTPRLIWIEDDPVVQQWMLIIRPLNQEDLDEFEQYEDFEHKIAHLEDNISNLPLQVRDHYKKLGF